MRIAACIPTRGDQDLSEIIASLPDDFEVVIWDNSVRDDLSVYGRYAAIGLTDAPVIYTQDDDVILDPESFDVLRQAYQPGVVTANMPPEFRHDFYRDHCLVGFGAIFDRNLPQQAFDRFREARNLTIPVELDQPFLQTCDVIFTALSTRHLVAVGKTDMPWASNPERMWKQPDHQTSRSRTLQLALAAR